MESYMHSPMFCSDAISFLENIVLIFEKLLKDNSSFFGEINDTVTIIANSSYSDKCIFQNIKEELVGEAESNMP